MRIAILTANLGGFDTNVDNVEQSVPIIFHRFTDEDFPPIIGLTPRMQYRIPKMFGWQMFPGYDYYLWLDGSFTLQHTDSVKWFVEQIKHNDIALFKHPWRDTIKEETDHIEEKLLKNDRYITPRYKNGLHKEQYKECISDPNFKDEILYTSTAFFYKNNSKVRTTLEYWWYQTSRYFTCDQIALPYVVSKNLLNVSVIKENQYKVPYLTLTSKHR